MKIYTLEEARLMHSIGITMRCINTRLPHFINQKSIVMQSPSKMSAVDNEGRLYSDINIQNFCDQWVIHDEHSTSNSSPKNRV